ncbi:MAG: hypothetical protein QOJ11_765 [Frankiales bacterium]|nr:hypothetical protein [Frankiales bacterium]
MTKGRHPTVPSLSRRTCACCPAAGVRPCRGCGSSWSRRQGRCPWPSGDRSRSRKPHPGTRAFPCTSRSSPRRSQPRGPPSGLDGAWCHRSWPGRGQPYPRIRACRKIAGVCEGPGTGAPSVGMRGPPYAHCEREPGPCHAATPSARRGGWAARARLGAPDSRNPRPRSQRRPSPCRHRPQGGGCDGGDATGASWRESTSSARRAVPGCGHSWGQGGDDPECCCGRRGDRLWIVLGKTGP